MNQDSAQILVWEMESALKNKCILVLYTAE